uniref:Uncharacterized protein n=1 Tax=Eutreptiella gymnastica TaxID=73025 RepID=A0A7S1NRC3_9EUGL
MLCFQACDAPAAPNPFCHSTMLGHWSTLGKFLSQLWAQAGWAMIWVSAPNTCPTLISTGSKAELWLTSILFCLGYGGHPTYVHSSTVRNPRALGWAAPLGAWLSPPGTETQP